MVDAFIVLIFVFLICFFFGFVYPVVGVLVYKFFRPKMKIKEILRRL